MTLAPTQYINTAHKKGDVLMRDQFFTHGDIPFVHFIHPLSTYCHTHVPTHDVWQVSFNSTHLPLQNAEPGITLVERPTVY